MRTRSRLLAAVVASTLLLTACGTDSPADPTGDRTTEPSGDPTGDAGEALRIVSLSPTATEMLYAVGAGDWVVAADSFSDFPPEAPAVEDLSAFSPNAEAIAGHEPDLVVLGHDRDGIVAQLEAVGIETLYLPAPDTIEGALAQIQELGDHLGLGAEALLVVEQMRSDIDELVASVDVPEGLTYYHELDETYYSVTSTTFAGDVYGLFGMTSIADVPATEDDYGYPQLSAEYIIEADPDLIFLADSDCCGVTLDVVAARPGWDQLSAVQGGHAVELGDDLPSRWGPRIVDFVGIVADALAELLVDA